MNKCNCEKEGRKLYASCTAQNTFIKNIFDDDGHIIDGQLLCM